MKCSDYIVRLVKEHGCRDIFGYQGGMIAHLADSLSKDQEITVHTLMHEQACIFAACAYAQVSGKIGWVFSSSGPGATNLITGICNAYYDSIPLVIFTGQVNINEAKGELNVRQKAFQETDIVPIVKSITKAVFYVDDARKIGYYIEKAAFLAESGRKGPVVIDLPMNIQRTEIEEDSLIIFKSRGRRKVVDSSAIIELLETMIGNSQRPVLILGNGFNIAGAHGYAEALVNHCRFPAVTSMISRDLLDNDNPYNFGFLGAYGHRTANFLVAKSDLVIAIGTRLDIRQIGAHRDRFAPNAKLLRIDIDENELENRIKEDEIHVLCDINTIGDILFDYTIKKDFSDWVDVCNKMREKLKGYDHTAQNDIIASFSSLIDKRAVITTDVGQNQVWVAQSFRVKTGQRILFSGGHGAMGYSLPAAIGAYYATKKPVLCFCGDGGLQMNIQELQVISVYKLPIVIVVLNNFSLGMIRHFQEMYLEGRFAQTVENQGYSAPNFTKIAEAYGINALNAHSFQDMEKIEHAELPLLINLDLGSRTYIEPKLEFGKPNQDQEPLIDRAIYDELMKL
jgi:acetolactate synthase-1/2/3 large subunit